MVMTPDNIAYPQHNSNVFGAYFLVLQLIQLRNDLELRRAPLVRDKSPRSDGFVSAYSEAIYEIDQIVSMWEYVINHAERKAE